MAKVTFKKNKNAKPWDFLKPSTKFTTEEVKEQRLEICRSCPEFLKLTQQCKLCLCIMPAKAILAHAECPIHKWGKTDEFGYGYAE